MIKFFREIRQRLLRENRISKYVLYALGEIILVVVGILIALQIGAWNEDFVNREKEAELLHDLCVDYMETKNRLEKTIVSQGKAVHYSRRILELYEKDALHLKRDSISEFVVRGALSWWRAEPITSTYETMISTGNIDLLQDADLKRKLAEFHTEWSSGFEDHEASLDLLSILTEDIREHPLFLNDEAIRKDIGLQSIDPLKRDADISLEVVERLKHKHSFFNTLFLRLSFEVNRLHMQKKMLAFVDETLEILACEK